MVSKCGQRSGDRLRFPLEVSQDHITFGEVIATAKTFKNRQATGRDNLPAEFSTTICVHESLTSLWAVCFGKKVGAVGMFRTTGMKRWCNQFSIQAGDPVSCATYRPISVLAIGYKSFATISLHRLKAAGADTRMQFGFRTCRSCADALVPCC